MKLDFTNWTRHKKLISWIEEMAVLCKPTSIHLCDGSQKEYQNICDLLVKEKVFVPLKKRKNSFWCVSDPNDVARVEDRTFICSLKKENAGPTNNWEDPKVMKKKLLKLFSSCMEGRIMYVIPYSMGPYGSSLSEVGIEITDSPYVVANMHIMARMGKKALEALGDDKEFVPGLHSVGYPLKKGQKDLSWPCSETKYIVHFPEERSIWSYGSGYGGNALLGKKCLALRIASAKAKDEEWLAEHMLILGITSPSGVKKYFCAAFPSACGKTNLAMIEAQMPGWKIECVGDDIAWMRFSKEGRLHAINPENGFFGVAPGTSFKSNPNAMKTIEKNTIFTNVALTEDGDVWWEEMSAPPEKLLSWKKEPWTKGSSEKAAHPNSRFTAPSDQCPVISPEIDNPEGVPIDGIIFGGRRASLEPLVYEAFNWQHGTFLGACLSSETTAAAKGTVGKLRHDPFAMLPFCGYNMGDYFKHWFEMGKMTTKEKLPKIFHVNWFLKDEKGKFLWPGFSENVRVLQWMFERCEGKVDGIKTPIGLLPKIEDLNLSHLSLSKEVLDKLFFIDKAAWKKEVEELQEYFKMFGNALPTEIHDELKSLKKRVES